MEQTKIETMWEWKTKNIKSIYEKTLAPVDEGFSLSVYEKISFGLNLLEAKKMKNKMNK